MNLLPPPGPQRRRLVLMIIALMIMGGLYWMYGRPPALVIPTSTGPAPTAPPKRVQAPPRSPNGPRRTGTQTSANADPSMPQALKLSEMEQVPDEPNVGRNPFRFGVPPPPPPPPYVPPPPPPPYTPPPPPPPPPIPLKLSTVIPDPSGRLRAYLTDPKTGFTIEGVEGQVIDGRYKLLKVSAQAVVIAFVDGSGQRTLNIGG